MALNYKDIQESRRKGSNYCRGVAKFLDCRSKQANLFHFFVSRSHKLIFSWITLLFHCCCHCLFLLAVCDRCPVGSRAWGPPFMPEADQRLTIYVALASYVYIEIYNKKPPKPHPSPFLVATPFYCLNQQQNRHRKWTLSQKIHLEIRSLLKRGVFENSKGAL